MRVFEERIKELVVRAFLNDIWFFSLWFRDSRIETIPELLDSLGCSREQQASDGFTHLFREISQDPSLFRSNFFRLVGASELLESFNYFHGKKDGYFIHSLLISFIDTPDSFEFMLSALEMHSTVFQSLGYEDGERNGHYTQLLLCSILKNPVVFQLCFRLVVKTPDLLNSLGYFRDRKNGMHIFSLLNQAAFKNPPAFFLCLSEIQKASGLPECLGYAAEDGYQVFDKENYPDPPTEKQSGYYLEYLFFQFVKYPDLFKQFFMLIADTQGLLSCLGYDVGKKSGASIQRFLIGLLENTDLFYLCFNVIMRNPELSFCLGYFKGKKNGEHLSEFLIKVLVYDAALFNVYFLKIKKNPELLECLMYCKDKKSGEFLAKLLIVLTLNLISFQLFFSHIRKSPGVLECLGYDNDHRRDGGYLYDIFCGLLRDEDCFSLFLSTIAAVPGLLECLGYSRGKLDHHYTSYLMSSISFYPNIISSSLVVLLKTPVLLQSIAYTNGSYAHYYSDVFRFSYSLVNVLLGYSALMLDGDMHIINEILCFFVCSPFIAKEFYFPQESHNLINDELKLFIIEFKKYLSNQFGDNVSRFWRFRDAFTDKHRGYSLFFREFGSFAKQSKVLLPSILVDNVERYLAPYQYELPPAILHKLQNDLHIAAHGAEPSVSELELSSWHGYQVDAVAEMGDFNRSVSPAVQLFGQREKADEMVEDRVNALEFDQIKMR